MAKVEETMDQFPRDFDGIHDTIRDICLRGYRKRKYFERIGVNVKNYDLLRTQVKYILNETDALKKERFINKPMVWQENPLARVFRYAVPNVQNYFYYYTIINYLSGLDGNTSVDIAADIDEICPREKEYEEQQVGRKANKLEEQWQIQGYESSQKKRWMLNKPIWDNDEENGFTYEELLEIYDYLVFLENVMPFELPFYLLRNNLELWFKREYKKEFEEDKREMFLFRHKNPINVLDSEAILKMLMMAKQKKKDVSCYIKLDSYEFYHPSHDEKRDEKKIYNYKSLNLNIEGLEFDCKIGRVYVKDDKKKLILLQNIIFHEKDNETGIISRNNPYEESDIFNTLNSVYFERLIELTFNYMLDTWKKEELIDHFFRGEEYWYRNIFDRVILGNGIKPRKSTEAKKKEEKSDKSPKVSVALFEQKKDNFSWAFPPTDKLFYTPKLAIEALKCIPEIHEFTPLFLREDIVDKIQRCTSKYESTWDINDIQWKNQKVDHISQECRYAFAKKMIQKFKNNEIIYDKEDRKYYPLRLQYSIYKDEFKVLAQDVVSNKLTILSQESINMKRSSQGDINLLRARESYKDVLYKHTKKMHFVLKNAVEEYRFESLSSSQKWKEIEEQLKKIKNKTTNREFIEQLKTKEKDIRERYEKLKNMHDEVCDSWNYVELDNILSDGWMNLLSSYEHETNYKFPKSGEKSGEFEVTLWYWEEDEKEILEEFESFESVFKMVDLEFL